MKPTGCRAKASNDSEGINLSIDLFSAAEGPSLKLLFTTASAPLTSTRGTSETFGRLGEVDIRESVEGEALRLSTEASSFFRL